MRRKTKLVIATGTRWVSALVVGSGIGNLIKGHTMSGTALIVGGIVVLCISIYLGRRA